MTGKSSSILPQDDFVYNNLKFSTLTQYDHVIFFLQKSFLATDFSGNAIHIVTTDEVEEVL
jgi:hypothetical protein